MATGGLKLRRELNILCRKRCFALAATRVIPEQVVESPAAARAEIKRFASAIAEKLRPIIRPTAAVTARGTARIAVTKLVHIAVERVPAIRGHRVSVGRGPVMRLKEGAVTGAAGAQVTMPRRFADSRGCS